MVMQSKVRQETADARHRLHVFDVADAAASINRSRPRRSMAALMSVSTMRRAHHLTGESGREVAGAAATSSAR